MKVEVNTHVGSYGIIIRNEKIALIKKARGGYTGKLDLPGGGIEHEETPEEALIREVKEEVNGTVKKYELFSVTSANIIWQVNSNLKEDLHHIGILYKVEIEEEILKSDADGLDSNGADWYPIKDLKKEELTPFTIYSLEKLGYILK